MNEPLKLALPDALVEQIAQRLADLLQKQAPEAAGERSPWMSFQQACTHLGFSPDQLYKLTAARAIPVRKKSGGQGLIFHREELDQWMRAAYPRLDRLP